MENVNLIVNVIGFAALGGYIWVLQKQIKSQKDILDSQNQAFENLKMYADIIQLDKIKEFVKMREETIEGKKNKDIEKIKLEMEGELRKRSDAIEFIFKQFGSLLKIVFNLTYYVQPELRKAAIKDAPKSETQTLILEDVNEFPYYGELYANALRKLLSDKGSFSDDVKVEKS